MLGFIDAEHGRTGCPLTGNSHLSPCTTGHTQWLSLYVMLLFKVLYRNIDQILVNSLHRLLNCEIDRLDCHVIATEYRTRVHYKQMSHLCCTALVRVIYSVVSGQYTYTIYTYTKHTPYTTRYLPISSIG